MIFLQDLTHSPLFIYSLAMAFSPNPALGYDDEASLTFAELDYSGEPVSSYSDQTMSNLTSYADRISGEWEADATIDPALLTQNYVASDISAYDASIQQS